MHRERLSIFAEKQLAENYAKAIANLEFFKRRDISKITSLDDLNFDMQFVAHSLQAVIRGNGRREDEERCVLERQKDNKIVIGEADDYGVGIEMATPNKDLESKKYYFWMPVFEPIVHQPEFENITPNAGAVDLRIPRNELKYFPEAHDPASEETLQKFAEVVKLGTTDVLEVVPPTLSLPSE